MKISVSNVNVAAARNPFLDKTQAREILTQYAANLVNAKTGSIKGGYLRLTDSGEMHAGHWLT